MNMDLFDFEQELISRWPMSRWCSVRSVIAVSGGADSVALVSSLARLIPQDQKCNLLIGHVNHGWRGEASLADQQFVENLGDQLEIQCEVLQAKQPVQTEQVARDERYRLLLDLAKKTGARYVLMAHHQDDQVETMIDRIFRGTGLTGLRGIPKHRELDHGIALVRPLLDFSRSQIHQYLDQLGAVFCQDDSNQDLKYMRNRIRQQLLPLIREQYHEQVDEAILRIQQMADDLHRVVLEQVEPTLDRYVEVTIDGNQTEVIVDRTGMARFDPYLLREMFVSLWKQQNWPRGAMTQQHWQRLEDAVRSSSLTPAFELPGDVRVELQGERLVLLRRISGGVNSPMTAT